MECSIESCQRDAVSRGLCGSHYSAKWQREKRAEKASTEPLICEQCGNAYVPARRSARNKFCSRTCKEVARITRGGLSLSNRKWQLKAKYGITIDEYRALEEAQGGCAICGTTTPVGRVAAMDPMWLHVDHDHETGSIRGLLCTECNTGIGKFKDSLELLSKAIEYLKRA